MTSESIPDNGIPYVIEADVPQREGWLRVAVIDGHGSAAEVHLQYENWRTGEVESIDWPVGWQPWVERSFLRSKGFQVITA